MHLPESAVCCGHLRGFGRVLRMRVDLGHREVTVGETDPDAELLEERLDDWVGLAAEGAFEVAVFDEGDRRRCGAADMIAVAHRK